MKNGQSQNFLVGWLPIILYERIFTQGEEITEKIKAGNGKSISGGKILPLEDFKGGIDIRVRAHAEGKIGLIYFFSFLSNFILQRGESRDEEKKRLN